MEEILTLLEDGNDIALVSDAGMPGISDPGEDLVRLAYQWDIPVTVLPGATAGLSALVLSGLPSGRFVFEGFLPREKREMERVLALLKSEERTIVLYEAPHRLTATLKKLYKALGNREYCCYQGANQNPRRGFAVYPGRGHRILYRQ